MSDGTAGRRVLVIGGTGVFGSRLVEGLLASTAFDLVLGGRNQARLQAFAAGRDRVSTLVLDARTVTADALHQAGVFAVVDAAGPWQGGQRRLAEAAIGAGAHCIDLADARDFVAEFSILDAAAHAAGVVALTGASSTPALSNAALDALTLGWRRVDSVEIAISPGNRAPRGLSVVRAILSYAGRPVRVFVDGAWAWRPGWGMTVRRTFPGVGRRWLGLAETPDLDIVPGRFGVRRSVVFRAGLELPVLHLGLWAMSLVVRAGAVRSLEPLARLVRLAAGLFERMGTDQGGMTVEATGVDAAGAPVQGRWSLVAAAGDGPYVPTLPAIAVLRALADGRLAPGARACVGVLPLAAIEAEFAGRRISSGMAWDAAGPSLYQRVLGAHFDAMPEAVRRLHGPGWGAVVRGSAQVDGAEGWLARVVAAAFRFPLAGEAVPVCVAIEPDGDRERWIRTFRDRRFHSVLSAGNRAGRLVERFGPFRFELDLQAGPSGVTGMPVAAWWLCTIRMPRCMAPLSVASESVDAEGRFCFDVEMRLPMGLGRLVRYRGWLSDP